MKTTYLLLASLAFCGSLSAAPVIDIAFSGGTTGSAPSVNATPAAGASITQPTSIYTAGGASLTLADNYTAGGTTLTGRSVVMAVDSLPSDREDAQLNIRANSADFSAGQDYRLSFDLLVNGSVGNLARNSLRVNFYNETFSATGYQASLVLYNQHTYLISGSENQTFNNTWTANTVLSWEADVLYSTGELVVRVNGNHVGTIALSPAALAGIGGIQFQNGAQDSSFELALANIHAAAIPEPGTVALLGIAGAFVFLRNRNRNRNRNHRSA